MKKLICLILGLLIFASCFSGLAESTETSFLQIKENVTAKVYANPGDTNSIDTLKGGWICGLLEETKEAGSLWFHIFYLSSANKGLTGYINAEDAKKLSQDELTALLEDPDMLNKVLDLIDAVDDYLRTQGEDDTAGTGTGANTNNSGNQTDRKIVKQFYAGAMEKLQKVFKALGSVDLSKAADAAKEIGNKVKTAGKDLLDQAKEKVDSAKDNVKGKLEDAKDKVKDIDLKEKLDEVNEKLKDINLKEKLEDVKSKLEDSKLNDRIDELKDKLEDSGLDEKLDGLKQKIEELDLKEKLTGMTDKLDGSGLKDTVEGVKSTVNALKDKESTLRQSLQSVTDALGQLFGNE